jgi:uncharacterized membrane protein YfcA
MEAMMECLSRFSPPEWQVALHKARHQQAEHLRMMLGRLTARRTYRATTLSLVRWSALGCGNLFCLMLAAHHGRQIVVIMAAIALASLVSSIAGFAFSAICGAMLFHLTDDAVQAVQIMVTCSIANQAAMTWAGRRDIPWRELSIYLAGGALGLIIGIWVLLNTDHARYTPALGVFLLAYGGYMFVRKPMVVRWQHTTLDFATGFLGGITGGAAGFPGAFVTIWCGTKGWDKARQRAVFQPFILIMQVATLMAISFARARTAAGSGFDISTLLFIPASLMGTSLGLSLYRRLSDGQFARAINVMLIVSGLSYVL